MQKILIVVVDAQYDFMVRGGALVVPGAEALISPMQAFLNALNPAEVHAVLFTADTHFTHEYPLSDEAKQFPPHCMYGTEGQRLVLTPPRHVPAAFMNKNEFSMWRARKLEAARVRFDSAQERAVYENLFHVTNAFNACEQGTPRDAWLDSLGLPQDVPVVILGVASDYCVNLALKGYLARGHQVTLMTKLMAGIGGAGSPAMSGKIEDVAAALYAPALASRQLRLA